MLRRDSGSLAALAIPTKCLPPPESESVSLSAKKVAPLPPHLSRHL